MVRTEECIRQSNGIDPCHSRIINKIRVNKEEHRHIYRFPRVQSLFLKTKTLYLAEIGRYLSGRHAVRGHTDNVFVTFVRRCVEGQGGFAGEDANFALLRGEFPGEDVRG